MALTTRSVISVDDMNGDGVLRDPHIKTHASAMPLRGMRLPMSALQPTHGRSRNGADTRTKGRLSMTLPAGRVHRQQPAPIPGTQRKVPRCLRGKEPGAAGRRASAHEHRRIGIVANPDRMPELM